MWRLVATVLYYLTIPAWPLFWVMCRLDAEPCPACGEWDVQDWKCGRCGHCWELTYRPPQTPQR